MTEDISPNVKTFESNYIVNNNIDPTSNIAMFIGEFEKGPILEPILITNTLEFKQIFGRSLEWNYNTWYQIYNYLQYPGSPKIWICRVSGDSNKANNNGNIVKTPGSWGNMITVEIYNSLDLLTNSYLQNVFNINESIIIQNLKQYLIIVKRKEQIVETFNIQTSDEIDSFYLEHINLEYGIYKLENGYETQANINNVREGFSLFTKENYEIDIVLSDERYNEIVIDFVEERKDCIAFLGIPREFIKVINVNNNTLLTESGLIIKISSEEFKYSLKNTISEIDYDKVLSYIKSLKRSQFVFFTFGFKYQLDGFTSKNRLINVVGDIAGLKAAASANNSWAPGAGVERGKIKDFISIPMKVNKVKTDELYKLGVNVLQNDILMSQKLFLEDQNKINRLHQRNILNYLERASEKLLRKYVFQLNERVGRANIANELKRLLEDMMGNRGIEGGKVIVKPDTLDESKIIINIYIKIINTVEFVNLRVSNVGTNSISTVLTI